MKYRVIGLISFLMLASAADARSTQRCKDHKPATAPTENFQINKIKGVVTQGNLMWKRCAEGQTLTPTGCENKADPFSYEDLNGVVQKNRRFAGMSGWRVPTIEELKGIVEKSCKGPAMNLEVFPNAPNSMLWGTSGENEMSKIWTLYSSTGVAVKSRPESNAMVRLVRDVR